MTVHYREALGWSRATLAKSGEALPAVWTMAETTVLSGEVRPDRCDDWVQPAREQSWQVRLHALESLCGQLASVGR